MDSIDKKILDLLQDNGRITVKEITQTISLTAPAVSERIKRMEKEGIIEGYTAIVDPKKSAVMYMLLSTYQSSRRTEKTCLTLWNRNHWWQNVIT